MRLLGVPLRSQIRQSGRVSLSIPMSPDVPGGASASQGRFATVVRILLAPVICCWSGLFTADFVLSGYYTWPRTSRVFVLTITLVILAYEFVYKEQRTREVPGSEARARRAVLYSCVIPYAVGVGLLLLLISGRF